MKTENLEPVTRMIVREVALGLTDDDICVNHPEFTPLSISRLRAGATFKRALVDMQSQIDEECIAHAAEDPVRQYMKSKGFSMAQVQVRLAENADGETPHAVQSKAADSILTKGGYGSVQENTSIPVLMLSTEKLAAVMGRGPSQEEILRDIPDVVDGHL